MMETFQAFKKRMLKNPEILREYKKLEPEYELARVLIRKRIKRGLTQAALAKKMGTHQTAVARLESGSYNPSVRQLHKIAKALDARLVISLT